MAEHAKPPVGTIAWVDLTVPDAPLVRDFYKAVVGWTSEDVTMDDYADFNMISPVTGMPAAGICHTRGANAPATVLAHVCHRRQPRPVGGRVSQGGRVGD